eukprot:gene31689-39929_t
MASKLKEDAEYASQFHFVASVACMLPTVALNLAASVHHLEGGTNATKLFGSATDVEKFQECLTCFIVAAKEMKSHELFEIFAHALDLLPEPWKGLHPRAMQ